jgi:hypothetical protein
MHMPPMPGVFPDYPAPVARIAAGEREIVMMRWECRHRRALADTRSRTPHWRAWLKPENRCLVPANSFAEYAPESNPITGKKDVCGSRSMRTGRCSPLPGSGPSSRATDRMGRPACPCGCRRSGCAPWISSPMRRERRFRRHYLALRQRPLWRTYVEMVGIVRRQSI